MALEFRERSNLECPPFIEVRKGLTIIGVISKRLGVYRYYEGDNVLNPSFSDEALDALKKRIEAKE